LFGTSAHAVLCLGSISQALSQVTGLARSGTPEQELGPTPGVWGSHPETARMVPAMAGDRDPPELPSEQGLGVRKKNSRSQAGFHLFAQLQVFGVLICCGF